jgi:hypothetical protein
MVLRGCAMSIDLCLRKRTVGGRVCPGWGAARAGVRGPGRCAAASTGNGPAVFAHIHTQVHPPSVWTQQIMSTGGHRAWHLKSSPTNRHATHTVLLSLSGRGRRFPLLSVACERGRRTVSKKPLKWDEGLTHSPSCTYSLAEGMYSTIQPWRRQ